MSETSFDCDPLDFDLSSDCDDDSSSCVYDGGCRMSDYVSVNCIEACPKCKHKQEFEYFDVSVRIENDLYFLDCDYMKDIIISTYSRCHGMFEPKEGTE